MEVQANVVLHNVHAIFTHDQCAADVATVWECATTPP